MPRVGFARALTDAQNESLDPDSQFDLAYGAAHRARASLRSGIKDTDPRIELRSFRTLVHTLGTSNADIQIFLRAHNERNLAEYGRPHGDRRKALGRSHPLRKEVGLRRSETLCATSPPNRIQPDLQGFRESV